MIIETKANKLASIAKNGNVAKFDGQVVIQFAHSRYAGCHPFCRARGGARKWAMQTDGAAQRSNSLANIRMKCFTRFTSSSSANNTWHQGKIRIGILTHKTRMGERHHSHNIEIDGFLNFAFAI